MNNLPNLVIREYRLADLDNCLYINGSPSKRRTDQLRMLSLGDPFYAFVAEESPHLHGYIIMEDLADGWSHYMRQVSVRKQVRRLGIGRRLVQAVEQRIGKGGHISLCTGRENQGAIDFYTNLGFKKSGFADKYRKEEDKYWFNKTL